MNKFSVIFKLSFINTIFFYLPVLANNSPVDYVNTLVGTQSKFEQSDPPTQSLDARLRAIRPYAGNRRSRVRTEPTCQLVFP